MDKFERERIPSGHLFKRRSGSIWLQTLGTPVCIFPAGSGYKVGQFCQFSLVPDAVSEDLGHISEHLTRKVLINNETK